MTYLLCFLGGLGLACLIVLLQTVALVQQMPWWIEREWKA